MTRRPTMTRYLLPSSLLLLPLLSACSGGASDQSPEPIALVQMAKATNGTVADTIALYGTAEAGSNSERSLAATAEAMVASIAAPAGTAVKAGQVVVRLTPSPQSALDLAKATSDAKAADAAYARAQRLQTGGLAGDTEVETARAAAEAADAALAAMGRRNGMLTLTAPVSGIVDAVLVRPGDLVAADAPVARIATGGASRAHFGIDPLLAAHIGAGSHIAIGAAAGEASITLPVAGVDRTVDPTTRLASVFADVPAGAGLAFGQPLRGDLMPAGGKAGIVIPYAAVQDDGGTPYVFVVTGGVAHRHEVKLGAQGGGNIIVLSGVAAGDEVVTQGGTALDDGMKVRTGPLKDDAGSDK